MGTVIDMAAFRQKRAAVEVKRETESWLDGMIERDADLIITECVEAALEAIEEINPIAPSLITMAHLGAMDDEEESFTLLHRIPGDDTQGVPIFECIRRLTTLRMLNEVEESVLDTRTDEFLKVVGTVAEKLGDPVLGGFWRICSIFSVAFFTTAVTYPESRLSDIEIHAGDSITALMRTEDNAYTLRFHLGTLLHYMAQDAISKKDAHS